MAATITIPLPPNTAVVLPPNGTLEKAAGAAIVVTLANASGEAIVPQSNGAATKFTIDSVPGAIGDLQSGDILLSALASGMLDFQFAGDNSSVSVTVTEPTPVDPPALSLTDHHQQLRYVRPLI